MMDSDPRSAGGASGPGLPGGFAWHDKGASRWGGLNPGTLVGVFAPQD